MLYKNHATSVQSSLINISIEINTNAPQNGGRMYPSRDVTLIIAVMNSFMLYVKGSIAFYRRPMGVMM